MASNRCSLIFLSATSTISVSPISIYSSRQACFRREHHAPAIRDAQVDASVLHVYTLLHWSSLATVPQASR